MAAAGDGHVDACCCRLCSRAARERTLEGTLEGTHARLEYRVALKRLQACSRGSQAVLEQAQRDSAVILNPAALVEWGKHFLAR